MAQTPKWLVVAALLTLAAAGAQYQWRAGQSPRVDLPALEYHDLVEMLETYQVYTQTLGLVGPTLRARNIAGCKKWAKMYNRAAAMSREAYFLDRRLPKQLDLGNCQ